MGIHATTVRCRCIIRTRTALSLNRYYGTMLAYGNAGTEVFHNLKALYINEIDTLVQNKVPLSDMGIINKATASWEPKNAARAEYPRTLTFLMQQDII